MQWLREWLRQWEGTLDPRRPERARPPARVVGYGEISTVLVIDHPNLMPYVVKRLPMFRDADEVASYAALHEAYLSHLAKAGIRVPETFLVDVPRPQGGIAVYMFQKRLPTHAVANRLLHTLPREEAFRLLRHILEATRRVYQYNASNPEHVALGFDAQVANWAVPDVGSDASSLPEQVSLFYFDTTTPLMRVNGQERLNPDLFLRSAPSFLVWIMKRLFLEEVMSRYYDMRQVVLDVIANLYKEKCAAWVPDLVRLVNAWRKEWPELRGPDYTVEEVSAYYRRDAFIWSLYLTARKIDRKLHELLGRDYPYILPEKIER